jgi:mRNA-degrading endonuclease RelE of RelBE toxin-antitoxin system
MYELIIPNNVKKDIKKLDKPIINKVIQLFDELSVNPFSGITLAGDLSHLHKIEFHMQGVSYRMVYEIFQDRIQVKIIQVGSRENFYNELRRRI